MKKTTKKSEMVKKILIVVSVTIFAGLIYLYFNKEGGTNGYRPSGTLIAGSYKAHGEIRSSTNAGVNLNFDMNVLSDKDYDITEVRLAENTKIEYVIKNDIMYSSTNSGAWDKIMLSNSGGVDDRGFKATRFTNTSEELDGLSSNFKFLGTISCSTGTCDDWQYTDKTVDIHIHISNNKKLTKYISKTTDGTNSIIDFDFATVPLVHSSPL